MRIQFSVPCVPVAQPRQRNRAVQTGGRAFATNYTPKTDPVNAFKAACQVAAAAAYKMGPMKCPLWMSVVFVFPRVKPAWLKKGSRWWTAWKAGARIPHAICRNDRDNLLKSLQDSLNGLVWVDDGQIYDGPTAKWLAADGEQPHVEVWIDDEVPGDDEHDCEICAGCELKAGCQTKPNFGCQVEEKNRRERSVPTTKGLI